MNIIGPSQLQTYSTLFSEYTELRAQENREHLISLVNGNVMDNRKFSKSGISARVYKQGVWGFDSYPDFTATAIKKVIESATQNALFLDARMQRHTSPLPQLNGQHEKHDFSTTLNKISQSEIMESLKVLDEYIVKHFSQLHSRSLFLRILDIEKSLVTSDCSSSYSLVPRTTLHLGLTVEKDGEPIELCYSYGGLGEFEDFWDPLGLCEQFYQQYEHLLRKARGIYPKAGEMDCILGAELAGILAHEAIGHSIEADSVMGGSVAAEYVGQKVASPLVTMVDFAHTYQKKICPVPVFIDDEGTQANDVVMVDQGQLKGFLHNKESANHFQSFPTGNARAYGFYDEPLIRMRNTAILPGKSSLCDMISSIDHGYYFMKPGSGQADSTGEFMFGVVQGYEIQHGRLARALKDTTISGIAFEMLKTVNMVSNDMVWKCSGMCGKKQKIPVAMGGPAIKCRVTIGGQ